MHEKGQITFIGIDIDGTIVHKPEKHNFFKRMTKIGLKPHFGVTEGIDYLNRQEDVVVLGAYTVRPEWLRKEQTIRQLETHEIPIENVTHSTNSYKAKIEALLMDSQNYNGGKNIGEIVLIDDSIEKVVEAAFELADERPDLKSLMEKLKLVAFNPEQTADQVGDVIPGVIHIVTMKSWSDVKKMLENVRS
jgi:hypothetical protein